MLLYKFFLPKNRLIHHKFFSYDQVPNSYLNRDISYDTNRIQFLDYLINMRLDYDSIFFDTLVKINLFYEYIFIYFC